MPNEYPEHIDQLDDFYRSQLADCEILPPDGLWDKISAGINQSASLTESSTSSSAASTAAISSISTMTKVIGGLVIGGVLAIGIYFFAFRSSTPTPTDEDAAPILEQPAQEQESPGYASPDDKSASSSTIQKQAKSSSIGSSHQTTEPSESNNSTPVVEEPSQTTPAVVESPKEEQRVDSIAEIKTPQKAPKEKVKFKDKYKKEYQDSTRKIFVPSK